MVSSAEVTAAHSHLLCTAFRRRRGRSRLGVLGIAAAFTTLGAGHLLAGQADLTVEEQLAFLKNAKVIASRPIGKGITGALRLTLSDGRLTHDAAFQKVDEKTTDQEIRAGKKRAGELRFVDSYRYNIAAWEMARLLGLEAMMPPTVERRYRGEIGALSWWVDDVLMDEAEREKTSAEPPEGAGLPMVRQRQLMQVFAELVYDTDRNKGNVVYTNDWQLVMLDFTRAFRTHSTLRTPQAMGMIDRGLLARLRSLTRQEVAKAVGSQLTPMEIEAMMKRRDLIVQHFDQLVKQRGEATVLFDAEEARRAKVPGGA
jgi:hypothetical protein